MALEAGFHSTVLPMSAGAVGRLPPIDVKLKGVTAYTNPSRGRYSSWFHIEWSDSGCSSRSCWAYQGLNRQKSISSQAASISAWKTVLDCPSMVAALSVDRQVVVSSSPAFRKTAARSSQGQADHSRCASAAAEIA